MLLASPYPHLSRHAGLYTRLVGDEVHLWQIGADEQLIAIDRAPLNLESRLQEWLARDISVLDPTLLVIGREVETDYGGFIDILCVDAVGDLVIVELKRDKTPREVTAQALDYASWVVNLSNERVTSIANEHLEAGFESAFRTTFGIDVPETLNGDHRVLVVGSEIDAGSERIIRYLSDAHGVSINAATFQYFQLPDGSELLARFFLIEPSEVELKTRTKGSSKRRPNLSYEELNMLAAEAGVRDLYDYAVDAFEGLLQKHTTRSSIGFASLLDGSRKTVLSLLPGDSSADEGLRYRLYKNRYAELANLQVNEVTGLLPRRHDDWIYGPSDAGPDWEGFEGFIVDRQEIDRLAGALRQVGEGTSPVGTGTAPGSPCQS
jgi:Endonuclease NucS C-terminal domain